MSLKLSTGLRNTMMGTTGFASAFQDGIVEVYSGVQPTTADDAETGTKLLRITVSSGAFTPGAATNGLEFSAAANGAVTKALTQVWSGVGLASGVAGWYRFYSNAYATGASSTAVRFDGICATTGGQLNMSSTNIAIGATTTIDSALFSLPANV